MVSVVEKPEFIINHRERREHREVQKDLLTGKVMGCAEVGQQQYGVDDQIHRLSPQGRNREIRPLNLGVLCALCGGELDSNPTGCKPPQE